MAETMNGAGAVYVQTNAPANEVVVYRRGDDGALERIASVPTGGSGDGVPHLTSQGSVVRSGDGRWLLATNAASADVSVFRIRDDALELVGRSAAGAAPKSVAERDGLVYVLATAKPAVTGYRLDERGLTPIPGSEQALSSASAEPAQVAFGPDRETLFVTERATDSIVTFSVRADGMLGEMAVWPSAGPTPYGFAVTSGGIVVVTEAFRAGVGDAAASSYRWRDGALEPVTRSLGNGRSEICWAVPSGDGRFVFTTNFADGAVSRYAIGSGGELVLEDAAAGLTTDGQPGLRDEDLTSDGRYLYAIDADQGRIVAWSVADDGGLSPIGAWDGLPVTVAGLAAV
jgi:6-phosphogluconolactonase